MKSTSVLRLYGLMACTAMLAACGGGGGSGGGSTPPPTPTFTVGGTLGGLANGATVVLQNSGSNLSLTANGAFTFATSVASGGAYAVTVLTQPANQTCSVTSGSGTVSANVTNVAVNCVTNPPNTFGISGTVSGLNGSIVIQNSGAANQTISANGSFTFPAQATGTTYAVTVLSHPTGPVQNCPVTNGSGTIAGAAVTNIAIICAAPNTYTVGGTVSGLATSGTVVLRNNGGNDLTVNANGSFVFSTPLNAGAAYAVTVLTNPAVPGAPASPTGQTCTPTNASGNVAAANITTVTITCVNNDTSVPTVATRSPLANAVGSKMQGGVVAVTFSEPVDPATVTVSTMTVASTTGSVSGNVALSGGNTVATFTPAAPLSFDEKYTVTLSSAIRDVAGNALASTVWSFNSGKKIAIGFEHTCVRLLNGSVKCWGSNFGTNGIYGQLGYDETGTRGTDPNPIAEPQTFVDANMAAVNLGVGRTAVAIAAGDYHTCAILDNGDTKCWGSNDDGELGKDPANNQLDTSNPAGTSHGIGDEPTDGLNGAGEMSRLTAINFGGGHKAIEIVGGQFFTCARLDDNTVKCFGKNDVGQLGLGNTTSLSAPGAAIDFGAGLTPISITAGHFHACAILQDNTAAKSVKCWGGNQWGQLGLGDTANRGDGAGEMGTSLPALNLGAGVTVDTLLATGGSNCAKTTAGAVKCWGLNTWGQVGLAAGNGGVGNKLVCTGGANHCIGDNESLTAVNATLAVAANAARLTIGFRHSCALLTNNTLKCWGSNEEGQIGLGDNTNNNIIIGDQVGEVAASVTAVKPATVFGELTAGGFHTCVWNTNGNELNCWGFNSRGQLGHNETYGQPPDAFYPGNYYGAGAQQMGGDLRNTNVGL